MPAAPIAEQPKATAAAAPTPVRAAAVGISTGLSNSDQFNHEIPVAATAAISNGVRIVLDGKAQIINLKTWESWSSDVQKRVLRGGAGNANSKAIDTLYEMESSTGGQTRSLRSNRLGEGPHKLYDRTTAAQR